MAVSLEVPRPIPVDEVSSQLPAGTRRLQLMALFSFISWSFNCRSPMLNQLSIIQYGLIGVPAVWISVFVAPHLSAELFL